MAMYYYASKISAIACGTRCRQTVLQKSRGQRDRDKNQHHHSQHHHHNSHHHNRLHAGSYCNDCGTDTDDELDKDGICIRMQTRGDNGEFNGSGSGAMASDGRIYVTNTNDNGTTETSVSTLVAVANGGNGVSGSSNNTDGIRYRRRYSEQLDAYDIELGFQKFEVSQKD